MKLLSPTASVVDPDICPRKLIVTLPAVLTLVDPKAAANARLLPQLCPLQGCVEELIAKSMIPANPVSVALAVLDNTGVPPKESCGINPVAVPVWEN